MIRKRYEFFEHTADIGLRAFGQDSKELFINAALGMFAIIARRKKSAGTLPIKRFSLNLSANNQEELLIGWLSELLALADIHRVVFFRFDIQDLNPEQIRAKASAEKMDRRGYEFKTEIKAVTYHQVKIEKTNDRWQAQVIFDL